MNNLCFLIHAVRFEIDTKGRSPLTFFRNVSKLGGMIMLISFAVVVAILFAFGGFFFSVLKMVKVLEAVFLSNRSQIDPDFFTDLQDRLAELADRGKLYTFLLGVVFTLVMFPVNAFSARAGQEIMIAMFIMCIKMVPFFILWNFICHWVAMKFSQENFAQAEKLKGLLKARGRVRGINRIPGLLLVLTVDMDQETRLFVLPKEIEGKFDWDAEVGSMVLVYYPEKVPVAVHVIVIDPIREEPEHWSDPNPATWVPHRGDWG